MSLDIVAYIYNQASAAYIYPVKFLFDGVEYNSVDIFVRITTNPGNHQIKMIAPGYVLLMWGTWPSLNIGTITFDGYSYSYANPSTINVSGDLLYVYCTVKATGALAVTIQVPVPGYEGIPVTVTASWDTAAGPFDGVYYWGDGASDIINTTLKITSKTHTYAAAGNYTIKVVVKDRNTGAQGENTTSIPIVPQLSATLSASPTSGLVPLAVTFTIGISGGYIPYTGGTLDYGDGASDPVSDSGTKVHTYTKAGTFTATLTFTDALGASILSRSKLSIGMEGVTIQPWIILAELAVGAVMIKLSR